MFGLRSLSPDLEPVETEIERKLRSLRKVTAQSRLPLSPSSTSQSRVVRSLSPDMENQIVPPLPRAPLLDHFTPGPYTSPSCIQHPEIAAPHFEIKSSVIQMLTHFYGLNNEDPYRHLDDFLDVCSTVKIQNFTDEALKLRLFPFSLKDRAKYWLSSLPPQTITTWAQLQQEFLRKYFPIGKTNQVRRDITGFAQEEGEQFYESWERFKELIRKCPHHQVPKWQLVQAFYDGLSGLNRQMVDSSCGGTFMTKNDDEAWDLFDKLSENSQHHASSRFLKPPLSQTTPKKGGMYEVSNLVVYQMMDEITRCLNQITTMGTFVAQTSSNTPL